jgi:hypothetical protein
MLPDVEFLIRRVTTVPDAARVPNKRMQLAALQI